MKKMSVFVSVLMAIWIPAIALGIDLPDAKWVGMKGADFPMVVKLQDYSYHIAAPISGDQPGDLNDLKMCFAIRGWFKEGGGYQKFQFRDFCMKPEILENDRLMSLIVQIPEEMQSADFRRVRMWGRLGVTDYWHIQGDRFYKKNTGGYPAYEFVDDGVKVEPVSVGDKPWQDNPTK